MSLNELPKQNWVEITKDQIKSIPIGTSIRIDGTEAILSYHYKAPTDYGFDTKHVVQDLGGSTFGSFDWNKNIKVEVLMNQGHPHAELMQQYAEDAKTHAEPWKLWQIHCAGDVWHGLGSNPTWVSGLKYRRKPKTHTVNGVEIPDISFTPKPNDEYFYPNPTVGSVCTQTSFVNASPADHFRLKHNLCYPITEEGKQAAILHAKAMLGIADA